MNEFFAKLWDHIEAFFTEAEKIAVTFMSAMATSIAKSGGALLVSAAQAAVVAAEADGGSGEEKLASAKKAVIGTLESEGVAVVMNAVNGAIEAAVAEMKSKE